MVKDTQKTILPTDSPSDIPLSPAEGLLRGLKLTSNVFEVTVERLGSAIKLGLYEPGAQLPTERRIAEIMKVSRATVREAIRLLAEQGVLVVKRGRSGGTFISKDLASAEVLSIRRRIHDMGFTLSEVLDHRLIIEIGIVELASQRAEPRHIKTMQDFANRMEQASNDYAAYRRLDSQFHLAIAQATQTNRLPIVMADIHAEASDLLSSVPSSNKALLNSTEQHQGIINAIKCNDSELARAIMTEHILATKSYLVGLL